MDKISIKRIWKRLTPIQLLVLGYISITLIGSILIVLPFSTSLGISQMKWRKAIHSTSASTGTGLIIEDTGTYYSLFGQIIVLILVQIGALGYMIGVTWMVLGLGGKLSITDRILLRESVQRPTAVDIISFVKIITVLTFVIEALGALLLFVYWGKDFGVPTGAYISLFHSVSAFCTSGFCLFEGGFVEYQQSIQINLIISLLSILGAIGFFVLYDVLRFIKSSYKKEQKKIAVYTKFSLLLTSVLYFFGFIVISISEINSNSSIMIPFFHSISASSTAGFNTVNISLMRLPSHLIMTILMFIGASSGGTGGGIKSSTFGVLILFTYYLLKDKKDVNIFKRVIAPQKIEKAFGIFITSINFILIGVGILVFTEDFTFIELLFESVSALGTTGLSLGITPYLSPVGKIVIIFLMLVGRIGPLAIGFSLLGKQKEISFKYPKADIFVG